MFVQEREGEMDELGFKAQLGMSMGVPLPPPTAKVNTKTMTWVPPSRAADAERRKKEKKTPLVNEPTGNEFERELTEEVVLPEPSGTVLAEVVLREHRKAEGGEDRGVNSDGQVSEGPAEDGGDDVVGS